MGPGCSGVPAYPVALGGRLPGLRQIGREIGIEIGKSLESRIDTKWNRAKKLKPSIECPNDFFF